MLLAPVMTLEEVHQALTNQAEAHYKGHKHARKLKAIEAQKNRQRRSGEASSAGRDRDREKDRERDRDRERNKTTTIPETPPSLMEGASSPSAQPRGVVSPFLLGHVPQ
ncbi:unnamed protein product [Arctogadus glacialis]